MTRKALLIEDDAEVIDVTKEIVADLGYEPVHIVDGAQGLEEALNNDFAFVILDLGLPSMKGSEVLKGIREKKPDVPVIMLTGKSDTLNKVVTLELGADDYVTKPFEPPELSARISAVMRRASRSSTEFDAAEGGSLEIKDLTIDFKKRQVLKNGEKIDFTAREFDILTILASEPGVPVSRDRLLELLEGGVVAGYEQSISTHINRIRKKIENDPANPEYILTVRGFGYCFVDLS